MSQKINWRYIFIELLIVIIGISIAFALNNWAQSHQNGQLKTTYIEALAKDIQSDLAQLEQNHQQLVGTQTTLQQMMPHLFQPLPGRDSIPGWFFKKSHEYVEFYPHNATYESMLHSGDLKLISDFQLKNNIVEHYNNYAKLFKAIDRHENFAKSYSADFFMKETNHQRLFSHQQPELLDVPFFRNLVFASFGITQIQIDAHKEAIQACQTLLEQLNKETA